MNASTLIVLLIIIVIAAFALKSSIGHFKGEGGCCGGGGTILPDEKELAGGKVNLKKNIAVVSFEREVSDEEIRKAVEEQDYNVLSIE